MRLFAATFGKSAIQPAVSDTRDFLQRKRSRATAVPATQCRSDPAPKHLWKNSRVLQTSSQGVSEIPRLLRDVSASRSRGRAAGFPVPCGRPLTAIRLSFYGHKCSSRRRDHCRGRIMRAQRVRNPVGVDKRNAEIERLQLELASFNKRIDELEQLHPLSPTIEALKSKALALWRQIDNV